MTGKLRGEEEKGRDKLKEEITSLNFFLYHFFLLSMVIFKKITWTVALDHPIYTCAYVEKEQAEEEGREQNETWKGYVRTATIRADQKPVGALVFQIRFPSWT